MTVWELCESMRSAMDEYGIEASQLESQELTAKATGADRRDVLRWKSMDVTASQRRTAGEMLIQRLRGKPVAYIIGEWDFYGHTFLVTPDVLIPRSDTEVLCHAALEEIKKRKNPKVMDLCCGSGCIGISIALEAPNASVTAVDVSMAALGVARQNAERYKLTKERYNAIWGDAYRLGGVSGRYDVLVCNPPYITAKEMRELDGSVRDYEPELALYGGEDGMDFYRIISRRGITTMRPGGCVLVECGWKQAREVATLFYSGGLEHIETIPDLNGIDRVVRAYVPKDLEGLKE